MPTAEDWARLGSAIRAERDELNLTQADVQAAGGPSTTWLRGIEGGRAPEYSPRTRTIRNLERVLKKPAGWWDSILASSADPTPPRLRRALEELLDDPAVTDQVKAAIRAQLHSDQESPGSAERTAG